MQQHPKLGPFTIIDRIAVGGMGVVFLAEHDDGSTAAVKLLDLPEDAGPIEAKLFVQEVQATARLHHESIIAIFDYGALPPDVSIETFGPDTPYYIMEYVPMGSLQQRPPENWTDLCNVLEQTLEALAHAHGRGVIHRDIKPANMLRGRDSRIVLTDFGIAHATFAQTSTVGDDLTTGMHETASGTPLYMSPEQFAGAWREYGPWTDLYSLGAVAWHFACGRPPFRARSFVELGLKHMSQDLPPLELKFDVPPHFATWVKRMTEKELRERPRSAAEALAELRGDVPGRVPEWRDVTARHRARRSAGAGLGLLGMRQVPTIGREDERDQIWSALQRCEDGLQVIHLGGPAGTGKSHLAEWASQLAVESGAARAYRVDNTAAPPLSGVPGLLHVIFRSAGLEGANLLRRVESFSHEFHVDVDPRFAADAMSSSSGSLSPDQAFEPAARLLANLCKQQPLLIWFDDLTGAPDVARFIEYLVERHPDLPALILVTSDHTPEGLPAAQRLELGFMPDRDVEAILRSQVDLPRRVLDQTLDRCQGSPLFAVLLLEDWVNGGRLRPGDDGLDVESSTTFAGELPESVAEIWQRRLDSFVGDLAGVRLLGPDRLRVASSPELVWGRLEAAAALGQQIDATEWDGVCEAHGMRTIPFLADELVRHRLAVSTPTGFRFVHGLLREVIAERARSNCNWPGLHLAAVNVLRGLYGEGSPRLGLRLARHLSEAGDPLGAMAAAHASADRARESFDVVALGEATAIWADCADAAQLPQRDPRRVDLWTMQAYALLLRAARDDRAEAAKLLERAAEVAATLDDEARLKVAARRTIAGLYLGDATARATELAGLLDVEANRSIHFEAHMALARAFAAVGDASRMLAIGNAATQFADDDARQMQVGHLTGRALLELNRLDEARDRIFSANALAKQHNWVIAEARGYETLAFIEDASTNYSEAAAWHRRSLQLFELVAPRTTYPDKQREYLARALLAAGDIDAAAENLAIVRAGVDSGNIGFYTHIEDTELAIAAAMGQWSVVETKLNAAISFEKFAPYELHFRALALASVHAQRGGRPDLAGRIRAGLAALTDDVEAELAAAENLV